MPVVINDIDPSILANADKGTSGVTVNSTLLIKEFRRLANIHRASPALRNPARPAGVFPNCKTKGN